MSELLPTNAWGDVLYSDATEEQETWYEDGFDAGFDEGYAQALVDSVGVVSALFVSRVDEEAD